MSAIPRADSLASDELNFKKLDKAEWFMILTGLLGRCLGTCEKRSTVYRNQSAPSVWEGDLCPGQVFQMGSLSLCAGANTLPEGEKKSTEIKWSFPPPLYFVALNSVSRYQRCFLMLLKWNAISKEFAGGFSRVVILKDSALQHP